MNTHDITFEPNDGSIEHALFVANGRAFDHYIAFDLMSLRYGDAAEIMRPCMKPGAKMVRVTFPDRTERDYVNEAAAKRAILRHATR